jgi:polysaccharide pyruvyl transferase CsaB
MAVEWSQIPRLLRKMTDTQVVLCGYYGAGNGGDEALLASMLEILPPNVKPLVLSANPKQTKACYGVAAIDRKSLGVVKALRSSQALILGGGSLIQDATSVQSALYYAGLVGLAQQFGLQTIAIGQGIGPLNQQLTQWVAQRAFGACSALSVRDKASAFILQDWSISCIMAPDPVWNLAAVPLPDLADLPTPRIAITLREHRDLTPERLQILTQALIELQQATNSLVLIVPFQASDLSIAQQIQAQMPSCSQVIALADPRQLKGVFQGVHLAIGMRYHSLIMAASEGCRCFALSYDPKIDQLMEEIEMPGWKISDIPLDKNQVLDAWLERFNQGEPLAEKRLTELQTKTRIHKELLAAALKNKS